MVVLLATLCLEEGAKKMKFPYVILIMIFLTVGCASSYYDKAAQHWDTWIGTSKDERVRDLGIPTRCHVFKGGGEACEFPVRFTAVEMGTMTLQFDSKGQVCQWTYRGSYDGRRSQSQCS